jgi:hypothetical protein
LLDEELQIGALIAVFIAPVDDQVMWPTKAAITVAVNQQAVAVKVSFSVAHLKVVVIVDPKHGQRI